MLGALVLAALIVVVIPVSVAMTGGIVAALLGWLLKENGESTHPGSELIDLNT